MSSCERFICKIDDRSSKYKVTISSTDKYKVVTTGADRNVRFISKIDSSEACFRVRIGTPEKFKVVINGTSKDAPIFMGNYLVIPKANNETTLQCKGMRMSDNVTVTKVPYFETSNRTGTTVYIASEV